MRELEKLLHSDVSEDRHYRNELKYVCSEGELQLILARIRHICPSDSHASATGTYSIRSIYFDDAQNRCFLENENGTDPERSSVSESTMPRIAASRWNANGKSIP